MFDELAVDIAKSIEGVEGRKRSPTPDEEVRFQYAIRYVLNEPWRASHSIPMSECSINSRGRYYFENRRYRDATLTYKQVRAAFEGLQALGLIEITKEGHFDHVDLERSLTSYVARDELRAWLQKLKDNLADSIKLGVDKDTIIYEIR